MTATPIESPLAEMFLHNLWANQQLLRACQPLADDLVEASVEGTYGSIRDTLLHIVRAETGYVRTLSGKLPVRCAQLGPDTTIGELRNCAAELDEALLDLAAHISAHDCFPTRFEGRVYQIPGPRFLVQIISHATEHRAQVATILTQLGIEPPDLSGWAYMQAMGLDAGLQ